MTLLFASDLHLAEQRPEQVALWARFVAAACAVGADAVYLLGDLVEAWLGDDDPRPPNPALRAGIARLTAAGIPVTVVHGNRDFLMGPAFAAETGAHLVPEAARIDVCGRPALIMHGDSLCTLDVSYQALRRQLRDPAWQARMLTLPLAARIAFASQLRSESLALSGMKDAHIMDVTQEAVDAAMRTHDVTLLVHGHTHRPAVHDFLLDGRPAQRVVLGDWYEAGRLLVATPERFELLDVETWVTEVEGTSGQLSPPPLHG